MEIAAIDYLRKKGFQQNELAFQVERNKNPSTPHTDAVIANQILSSETREIEGGTDKVLAAMKPTVHPVVTDEASTDSDNIWQRAISKDFFRKLAFPAMSQFCEVRRNMVGCFNPPTCNPPSTMVPMPPIGCVEDFKIVINGVDFTPYSSTHFRSMYWDLCKRNGAYLHENSRDISSLAIYREIIYTVKMARDIKNSSAETLSDVSSIWLSWLKEINRIAGIDVTMIQNWLCDRSSTQKTKAHDTGPEVLGQDCDRCGGKKRKADGAEVQGQDCDRCGGKKRKADGAGVQGQEYMKMNLSEELSTKTEELLRSVSVQNR